MNRNETIVWLIEKGRELKAPEVEEIGEKEAVEEQDKKENVAFASTEKSAELMDLLSQDSILPFSDHESSQFSDVSQSTSEAV